jgi:hypothetical protein
MTQTIHSPHVSRNPRTLGLLIAALSLAVGAGCSHPAADETISATFFIRDSDVLESLSNGQDHLRAQDVGAQASPFSFNDVQSIKISVTDVSAGPGTVVMVNFDLNKNPAPLTGWSGTITSLPKGKALLFNASAYKTTTPSDATRLFSGDTAQTLTAGNQSVLIALSAANDQQSIALPRTSCASSRPRPSSPARPTTSSSSPVPSVTGTTRVGTMDDYTPSVRGKVVVAVTDPEHKRRRAARHPGRGAGG